MRVCLPLAVAALGCAPIAEANVDVEPARAAVPQAPVLGDEDPPAPVDEPRWEPSDGFVVHEWGTFTALAAPGGELMEWSPLVGASDLPEFVYRSSDPDVRRGKSAIPAPIRMETPVLYFYSDVPRHVSAKVEFVKGHITEWYPAADQDGPRIDWGNFFIDPDPPKEPLIDDGSVSHYYPARDVDAAIVTRGEESDRFLFYRGVGRFSLGLRVSFKRGKVKIARGNRTQPGSFVVLNSRDGKVGFTIAPSRDEASVALPPATQSLPELEAVLRELLIETGLYAKEADAMLATWRDYWFEDGVRVFYLMKPKSIAKRLPLELDPQPDQLVRTIVGRIEVVTPETAKDVEALIFSHADPDKACEAVYERYKRFGQPIAERFVKHPLRADSARDKHFWSVLGCISQR